MSIREKIEKNIKESICKLVECIIDEEYAQANVYLSNVVNEHIKRSVDVILQENQ